MNKKNILGLFSLLMMISISSCSNKFHLEKKSSLSFNESYYSKWTSGVQGQGSGFAIYLVIDKSVDVGNKDIKILGIYFREKYSTLKYQGSNKYQGFIKNNENLETVSPDSKITTTNNEIDDKKIPFSLKDNEAVVSYKINEKQKYVKINLIEKQATSFPM